MLSKKQVKKERKRMQMMAPAHAFMQKQSAAKIANACAELKEKTSDPLVLGVLARVQEARMPVPVPSGQPGMVKVATAGMCLVGQPEVFVEWPEELTDTACGIMEDLVLSAMNGDRSKLADGRKVLAYRFNIAYEVRECKPSQSPLFDFLETHTTRPAGVPFAVYLDLVASACNRPPSS
eukprot:4999497-Prymnesium_polylepis.4